ncbi:MAG: hypothetical protein ORN54_11385 [Cyclobacteriaceae bacterium]|nr:hypothetical protein [Cyclobacteriaceae bacterium]
MSSHHFVKEDQEPALLIICPTAISFEKIQELLEWSPTIVVNAKAIPIVQRWGIKIDVVLCSESEQEELATSLADQLPIRFISFQAEVNPLSVGYDFLKALNYKAVNILIERLTDLDLIQDFYSLNIEVFFDQCRWVFVRSRKFEKWLPQGNRLSIYPNVQLIQLNLDEQFVSVRDGKVKLESESPFWVGEELT